MLSMHPPPDGHRWQLVEARDLEWEPRVDWIRTTRWTEIRPMVWVEEPYDHVGATVEEVLSWVHRQEQDDAASGKATEWQVALIFDAEAHRSAITIYGRDPVPHP